uniref:Exonuclease 1 n=1 Tax=Ditylenchus dipsaci TaxID=166011 RepID=A0A915EHC3_9BILA
MGITGLLPFVKRACREGNLLEFKGKTIAVDVSCLLHRGVFGCADQMAKGKETDFYVHYVKRHVNLLLKLECHVILVFDGQPLPAKKEMNDVRKARRDKNQVCYPILHSCQNFPQFDVFQEAWRETNVTGLTAEANKAFRQGVTITRDVVEKTIKAFQRVKLVDVIVAPFEADAQIAFLLQKGLAHAAVTEDSDLIAFGCETIIFKLDSSGTCMIYEKSKLPTCVCQAIQKRFDFRVFLRICILAGCDYLMGGLQGVGLRKAEMFFAKTTNDNLNVILPKLPMYLNMNIKVNKEFIQEFIKAENTFLYQVVFDPLSREQVPLNPYPEENDENDEAIIFSHSSSDSLSSDSGSKEDKDLVKYWYAGSVSPASHAIRRALGNIALSGPSMQDLFVLPSKIERWSIWSYEYLDLLAERNLRFKNLQNDRMGAFVVTRATSSAKRPRVPSIDVDHDESEDSFIPSKKRFSEPIVRSTDSNSHSAMNSLRNSNLKNGSTMSWNSNDWMKMYGVGPKRQDLSRLSNQSGSSSGFNQQLSTLSSGLQACSPSREKIVEGRIASPECLNISDESIDFIEESPLKSAKKNQQCSIRGLKSPKVLNPFSKKSSNIEHTVSKEISLSKNIVNGTIRRFSALRPPFRRSLDLLCGTKISSLSGRKSDQWLLQSRGQDRTESISQSSQLLQIAAKAPDFPNYA